MDTIFMNTENSKTSDLHSRLLNLSGKINIKSMDKYFALLNLSIYNTWKYITNSYKNNEFKTSAPKWNEKLELTEESYSVSEISRLFWVYHQ